MLKISAKALEEVDKYQILFAIKDMGISIPEDKIGQLFKVEMLRRLDHRADAVAGGR